MMPTKYISKLQGQRVLLLGGTSGIGFAVAEAALEHGATVIISGSNESKTDNKVKELEETYPDARGRIFGKSCNLSDLQVQEKNIIALLDFATENKTKALDHIVNTTGDGLINPPFSELTVEIISKAQTIRAIAPLMLAKHAPTYLNKAPSSSITFTSGAGTYKPAAGWTLTPVIGGMLDGLVRSLAINIAPIRVNGVAPGAVMTELWGRGHKLPEEKAKAIADGVAGRLLTSQIGTPEDLAEAYIYFMRDGFVTGQMVLSEGGSLLKP
jgi:NAD(P)-dependent dehydrogenase (short-subunit alcohol dehydrogenase family)